MYLLIDGSSTIVGWQSSDNMKSELVTINDHKP